MEPTVGMLSRLLEAAGLRLELTAVERDPTPALADLSGGPRQAGDVDWTQARALLDWVAQHPARTAEVIGPRPSESGSALLDSLLAGIAEKLADDAGLVRPAWTAQVASLPTRWEPSGTPRMLAKARAATPSQLAARNITLAGSDLWRSRA